MKLPTATLLVALLSALSGCLKEPGPGGAATITGKIYAYDYNAEMNSLRTQYYAPDEEVFIIYGDDSIFSDRTRSSYDGSYRFEYLRPGSYTIFAYSKNVITKLPPVVPIKKTVEVPPEGGLIHVGDIEINK